MMRRFFAIAVVLAVVALALLNRSDGRETTAQEATAQSTGVPLPTASPTAYPLRSLRFSVLTRTDVNVSTDGPVTVSVATV